MADEYLLQFLQDAQSVVYGLFGILEFVFGIGYISGKYLTVGIFSTVYFLQDFAKDVVIGFELFALLLEDLIQQIARSIFLIYYGIGLIVDAFYITFCDLVSFVCHTIETTSKMVQSAFFLLLHSVASLAVIPDQLCVALSLIGDFFLGFCNFVVNLASAVLSRLILTPVHLFNFMSNLIVNTIWIPVKIVGEIPESAYIGLFVVLLCYFIYCRLSLRLFFTSCFNLLKRAAGLFTKVVTFLNKCSKKSQKVSVDNNEQVGSANDTKGLCVICQEIPVTFIANPCHHISLCRDCCYHLVKFDNRCPMCRKVVDSYARVYIS